MEKALPPSFTKLFLSTYYVSCTLFCIWEAQRSKALSLSLSPYPWDFQHLAREINTQMVTTESTCTRIKKEVPEVRPRSLVWASLLGSSLGRIQGIPSGWEREVRPALIGPSLQGKERERKSEWPDGGCSRVWQSLAMLYFLPWLLHPKLVHF